MRGATRRANFSLSGPLAGNALTTRLYGNLNKTDADSWDINSPVGTKNAAGHEGVRNKDINGVVSWKLNPQQILDFEAGYSRRGEYLCGRYAKQFFQCSYRKPGKIRQRDEPPVPTELWHYA